jgi:hypothetical protein
MNGPTSELDQAERPRAAAMKFTYPSGARPLEGYTIKRGVGRGGFGEVYFATSDAGKEVALKLIRRNLDVELRGVTQCLNLKHPNLIALYDIRTDEMGDQWVVMEYVSGEALEDVIDRHPSGMPVDQAIWWMRGVCAGVAYLHDHGIVHRDLKPGNIFSDEGTVKIGDYGLAKFISCSRRSGQTESVGTVHYMAPEIANGRYGREIDTYALGVILFEMLTGRVPFEGESVGEVLMKHLTAEPDLSTLEAPYREIVERALAKDPQVRISNVSELLALLPGGEGVVPPPRVAESSPTADQPKSQDAWPLSRGPVLKAADAAAMEGFKQVVTWKKSGADAAGSAGATGTPIEEPIWKAIREVFSGERLGDLSPVKRGLIIFGLVLLCVMFADKVFSYAIPVLICYWIYYAIWSSMARREIAAAARKSGAASGATAAPRAPNERAEQHTVAWAGGAAAAAPAQKVGRDERRRMRLSWRDRANQELAAKPLREKLSELFGSMLLAAVFAILASCAVPLLLANQPGSEQAATFLWLALAGTLGSWAILIPTKFIEGKLEDQIPMRITLLTLGAIVGLISWGIGEALMLKTPGWNEPVDVVHGLISQEMLGWPKSNGVAPNPGLAVYIAYFSFLFLLPRWWRQAEYTRTARLSLWTVIVCISCAWLLHVFWWFPQPNGMLLAGVIAVSTQLASPWMPPSRRRALGEYVEQTA